MLQAQGSPQRALQTLRRGTTKAPEATRLHAAFIELALTVGDGVGALAYLKDAVASQVNPPATLYSLAALLPSEYETDINALLQEGRSRYPADAGLAVAEARRMEAAGEVATAEAVLQDAFNQNPGNAEVVNALAVLQARQGKLAEARATFESLGGQNATVQANLANLYLDAGEFQAAIDILSPLVQQNPNDVELKTSYGVALGRSGQTDAAVATLNEALRLEPDNARASRALALLQQQGALTGGQQVQLSQEATALFSQGLAALEASDYGAAASAFSQARTLSNDDGLVAFYQGYALYLSGQDRPATEAFERALTSFPNNSIILNNLGLAYLNLGRFDKALDNLNSAVASDAQNDQAHLNLGLANYQLERYSAAVSSWETALSLNPGLETAVAELLQEARSRAAQ